MKKILLALFSLVIIYLLWANKALQISNQHIVDKKIPDSFKDFRIAHLSDYHNEKSKRLNNSLIESLERQKPDLIVITGDFVDARKPDYHQSLSLIDSIKSLAPIYYVTGNHEAVLADITDFKEDLKTRGVYVLENESKKFYIDEAVIMISGLEDPKFINKSNRPGFGTQVMTEALDKLDLQDDTFNLLLSHRPEYLNLYQNYPLDLVLSGHAHGGQVRLPFVGGVFAPSQGFFPKFSEGLHQEGQTKMIVSRGLGPSIIPLRVNNRPELIYITLENIK